MTPVIDHDEPVMKGSEGSGDGMNTPLPDASISDLLTLWRMTEIRSPRQRP